MESSAEQLRIDSHMVTLSRSTVYLQSAQCAVLETILEEYVAVCAARTVYPDCWMTKRGAPSFTVRFDMSPMVGTETPRVFEIDPNAAGWSLAERCGMKLGVPIRDSLKAMNVEEISSVLGASRVDQVEDQTLAMASISRHGIKVVHRNAGEAFAAHVPCWIRSVSDDTEIRPLRELSLNQIGTASGDKSYLVYMGYAERLNSFVSIEAIFRRYPRGFIVKPETSWGCEEVHGWAPDQPWKEWFRSTLPSTRRRLEELLRSGRPYLIQPFYLPEIVNEDNLRIWRIFGVWDAATSHYRVVGGMWCQRPKTLRNHGAEDAVFGPIRCQ